MCPPINVAFWTTFYETYEDPDRTYHNAIAATDDIVERAARLWDWKDLGRGVDFESVRPILETTAVDSSLKREPAAAVDSFGRTLVESGALANATVVTPAFILHLADSDPNEYSVRFPIFDARVWTAFVFLSGRRSGSDTLPVGATTSARKYGEFVNFFDRTLPDDTAGRTYERALFRFGSYISNVPETEISEIRTHLNGLEAAVDQYADSTANYLIEM
ncbi:hypothetical protein [Natrinema sp. SYSU A 869]|uniref:hypothetical protein n=1 Tax=Natrinema sp. SYSU A 869 TaxID=2871694 RepID=UPI001CA3BB6D|nr:hypothetical protein [Natrinema sp. SYSU A 869]